MQARIKFLASIIDYNGHYDTNNLIYQYFFFKPTASVYQDLTVHINFKPNLTIIQLYQQSTLHVKNFWKEPILTEGSRFKSQKNIKKPYYTVYYSGGGKNCQFFFSMLQTFTKN